MAETKIRSQDILDATITDTDVATANKDGIASLASLRTLGTGAAQAAPGNDSRFLPTDTVVVAGTRILANKLVGTDTQPAFRLFGDGKHEWGPGGTTAPDTSLYRVTTAALKTDGQFHATGQLVANVGSANVIQLDPNGRLVFNSDTTVYRPAGGVLKTDGRFIAADPNYTILAQPAAVGGYAFATFIGSDSQPRFRVLASTGEIDWGPGGATAPDTSLYRDAVGVLRTPGSLLIGSQLRVANIVAAAVGGAQGKKLPIYDDNGILQGYIPIYAS